MSQVRYPDEIFEALIAKEPPDLQHVARVAYYDESAGIPSPPLPRKQPYPGEVSRIIELVGSFLLSTRIEPNHETEEP